MAEFMAPQKYAFVACSRSVVQSIVINLERKEKKQHLETCKVYTCNILLNFAWWWHRPFNFLHNPTNNAKGRGKMISFIAALNWIAQRCKVHSCLQTHKPKTQSNLRLKHQGRGNSKLQQRLESNCERKVWTSHGGHRFSVDAQELTSKTSRHYVQWF